MTKNTKIEWAHHTFNPWTGCTKVSPGCDHCYAEGWAKRSGTVQWGPHAERRRTTAANWRQPLKWHDEALANGIRYRVFCASLADVFDNAVPEDWRSDLAALILATAQLDWLLVTKRIGNAASMLASMFPDGVPANVWIGATIINQQEADRDIPKLLATPAAVRFLSMEPLLGPVDIRWAITRFWPEMAAGFIQRGHFSPGAEALAPLDWIIAGGESGPGARPMDPDWPRSLRDQCSAARVPFLFKQWGESLYGEKVGKTAAGRMLDGQEWTQYPCTRAA